MRLPWRSIPAPVRHTRTALPSVKPHCEVSFRAGLRRPWLTISGRLCRANAIPRPATAPPVQLLHVDAAIAIGNESRKAVFQRLIHHSVDGRPVLAVAVDEAAVERRKQTPALVGGHRHRARAQVRSAVRTGRDRTPPTFACGRTTRRTRRSAGSRPRSGTPSREPAGARERSGPCPTTRLHRPADARRQA